MAQQQYSPAITESIESRMLANRAAIVARQQQERREWRGRLATLAGQGRVDILLALADESPVPDGGDSAE